MQHYFINKVEKNTFYFQDEDIHHILHVMRFKNNDEVVGIFDHKKFLLSLDISKDIVSGKLIKEIESKDTDLNITLIHGMPKNDKFELALQKATELGVSKIVPFLSERSIIRIEPKDFLKKIERWDKIVKEACEQSERNELVIVEKPSYLKELIKYKSEINIICDETYARSKSNNLYDELKDIDNKSITFIVGPEGGFSNEELEFFNKNGFISVSLGPNILRSETAVISFLSAVRLMRK